MRMHPLKSSLKFPDETMPDWMGDYYNEPFGYICAIRSVLKDMGIKRDFPSNAEARASYADIPDESFLQAINTVRKDAKICTIKERYIDEGASQLRGGTEAYKKETREKAEDCIAKAPKTTQRLDELAHTINTTQNVRDFKLAMNEMVLRIDTKDTVCPAYPVTGNLPPVFADAVLKAG